jgi:hypothetical protein
MNGGPIGGDFKVFSHSLDTADRASVEVDRVSGHILPHPVEHSDAADASAQNGWLCVTGMSAARLWPTSARKTER